MTHDLLTLAAAGYVAGLAVAMPLGAIGVLILRESMVGGLRTGLGAAGGVATVDLVYCAVAVAFGAAAAEALAPWSKMIAFVSGLVIIGIGLMLLRGARRPPPAAGEVVPGRPFRVYARFVALTALNPATVVYFLALAGVVTTVTTASAGPAVFVVAAGLGSLLWQAGLAIAGTVIGARVSPRTVRTLGIVAAAAVITLGIVALVASRTV
ncbi:LysE family translocator [Demequina mangrovi]|uniref:Threonine/homoserine/homoserine lactone efflux protein n=1 Tax=Demequina mangrovi TaxID=1043493 RepID=A0A1H6XR76_9MICO|nr:LysE family transporter [Demequina mangrovi]SEJ31563.1 Threonine/homoserine/homoserine lactone efflux protein [Demequina mangrovi]